MRSIVKEKRILIKSRLKFYNRQIGQKIKLKKSLAFNTNMMNKKLNSNEKKYMWVWKLFILITNNQIIIDKINLTNKSFSKNRSFYFK